MTELWGNRWRIVRSWQADSQSFVVYCGHSSVPKSIHHIRLMLFLMTDLLLCCWLKCCPGLEDMMMKSLWRHMWVRHACVTHIMCLCLHFKASSVLSRFKTHQLCGIACPILSTSLISVCVCVTFILSPLNSNHSFLIYEVDIWHIGQVFFKYLCVDAWMSDWMCIHSSSYYKCALMYCMKLPLLFQ